MTTNATAPNPSLDFMLQQFGASMRLRRVLWYLQREHGQMTLRHFLEEFTIVRLRKELFGFGKKTERELRAIIETYPDRVELTAKFIAGADRAPGKPIRIGIFGLRHLGEGKMWIEVVAGEFKGDGMETTVEKVEQVIHKFFAEEF